MCTDSVSVMTYSLGRMFTYLRTCLKRSGCVLGPIKSTKNDGLLTKVLIKKTKTVTERTEGLGSDGTNHINVRN